MSLKLKIKERLLSTLESLPRDFGDRLYHSLQNYIGASSLTIKKRIKRAGEAYELVNHIAKEAGLDFKDKEVIEIGSGWLPLLPYFLLSEGKASKIFTYDINAHYDRKKIAALNKIFFQAQDYLEKIIARPWSLPAQVEYFPKTNINEVELPYARIIVSRYVLEHVRPEDISMMHHKFKKELPSGSFIIHLISPSDHRAFVDPKLSLQDFLQFSKEEWKRKYNRFNYHNRLRLPQYLQIFKDSGLRIVNISYDKYDPNSETYTKFKKINLHSDFKRFSEEELLAGSIHVVLQT